MKQNNTTHISRILIGLIIFIMSFAFVATAFAAQSTVNLGSAGNFEILAKTGISTTGTTAITGNVGISPAAATFITGFGLIADTSNTFARSSLITGKVYAADYAPPTPTVMTTAIGDMETAYTDAAGRTLPDHTELGAGNIDGMTLSSGLYKWGTGVTIPTGVTLTGGSNDIFIFQIAQDLTLGNGAIVALSGGVQAKNIFWQVAGQATFGTTSSMKGIILSQTAIIFNTGATLNGKALAQTAVTLDSNDVLITAVATTSNSKPNTIVVNENKNIVIRSINKTDSNSTLLLVGTEKRNESIKSNESSARNESEVRNQTSNGIGQILAAQIVERKEELRLGNYTGSFGQQLNVRELSENLRELREENTSVLTYLNITADIDSNGRANFSTKLHDAKVWMIKIMPQAASQRALDRLGMKVCTIANNCTIQLKNVGTNLSENISYEMQLDKDSKLFGIFKKKMHITVDVDSQNGNVVVHKPFWAFLAKESE